MRDWWALHADNPWRPVLHVYVMPPLETVRELAAVYRPSNSRWVTRCKSSTAR